MIPIIPITAATEAARAEADETRQEALRYSKWEQMVAWAKVMAVSSGNRVPKGDSTLASFLTHVRGADGPHGAHQPGPTVSWNQSFGQIIGRD